MEIEIKTEFRKLLNTRRLIIGTNIKKLWVHVHVSVLCITTYHNVKVLLSLFM